MYIQVIERGVKKRDEKEIYMGEMCGRNKMKLG